MDSELSNLSRIAAIDSARSSHISDSFLSSTESMTASPTVRRHAAHMHRAALEIVNSITRSPSPP